MINSMKALTSPIDTFLNRITMYRLMLYILLSFAALSFGLSLTHTISFSIISLLESLVVLLSISFLSNYVISKLLKAPINLESQWITAFILYLVLAPPNALRELWVPAVVALMATVSKYVFVISKKHVFNPVAISLVLLGLIGRGEGIWWVGTPFLLPVAVVGGALILRKLRRFELFFSFMLSAEATIVYFGMIQGMGAWNLIMQSLLSWPIIFFGTIMLTEPQTTPPTKRLQVVYGALVGLLFGSPFHIAILGLVIYSTPELALVLGNVLSYISSPKQKLFLTFVGKKEIAQNTFEFVFSLEKKLNFSAGQYLEWTLPHTSQDARGTRRYFTVSSSPTENSIVLCIRYFPESSSSFKVALQSAGASTRIVASQLAGDFVLPKDTRKKLVFIAGGIGITPFRSIIKYLLDTGDRRDITLFYSNRNETEIAYRELFDEASVKLGIKIVYTLTERNSSANWQGKRGFVDTQMIRSEVPDFSERLFYVSGPRGMVVAFEETLGKMGVAKNHIKTDFFPGFV